eukprot:10397956-Alexandrium_andersonii.AAC.1
MCIRDRGVEPALELVILVIVVEKDSDVLHEGRVVVIAYGDDPSAAQLGSLDIPLGAHLIPAFRCVT